MQVPVLWRDRATVDEMDRDAVYDRMAFKKKALTKFLRNAAPLIYGDQLHNPAIKREVEQAVRSVPWVVHWIIPLEIGGTTDTGNMAVMLEDVRLALQEKTEQKLSLLRQERAEGQTIVVPRPSYGVFLPGFDNDKKYLPLLNEEGQLTELKLPLCELSGAQLQEKGFPSLRKMLSIRKKAQAEALANADDLDEVLDAGGAVVRRHHRRLERQLREANAINGGSAKAKLFDGAKKTRQEVFSRRKRGAAPPVIKAAAEEITVNAEEQRLLARQISLMRISSDAAIKTRQKMALVMREYRILDRLTRAIDKSTRELASPPFVGKRTEKKLQQTILQQRAILAATKARIPMTEENALNAAIHLETKQAELHNIREQLAAYNTLPSKKHNGGPDFAAAQSADEELLQLQATYNAVQELAAKSQAKADVKTRHRVNVQKWVSILTEGTDELRLAIQEGRGTAQTAERLAIEERELARKTLKLVEIQKEEAQFRETADKFARRKEIAGAFLESHKIKWELQAAATPRKMQERVLRLEQIRLEAERSAKAAATRQNNNEKHRKKKIAAAAWRKAQKEARVKGAILPMARRKVLQAQLRA